MFIDEIKHVYKIGTEEEQWLSENIESLDESQKLNFLRELQNYKAITITVLKKVYQDVTGKSARVYFWAVCMECGCEYDYGLPICPDCYDRGFECRVVAIKKSEFQPTFKVINYNKQYLTGDKDEKLCYNCENKKESYCRKYGNPNWQCKREEFEICKCKLCCGVSKRANKILEDSRKVKNYSYAIPLKKVEK